MPRHGWGISRKFHIDGLMKFTQGFAIPCLLFLAISHLDLSASFDPRTSGQLLLQQLACVSLLVGILGARLDLWPGLGRLRRHRVLLSVLELCPFGIAYYRTRLWPRKPDRQLCRSSPSIHPFATGVGITVMEVIRNRGHRWPPHGANPCLSAMFKQRTDSWHRAGFCREPVRYWHTCGRGRSA